LKFVAFVGFREASDAVGELKWMQGCQIFHVTIYQNGESKQKTAKLPKGY
jgi:hypothetical protein